MGLLICLQLSKKYSELGMHGNDEEGGISAKNSKARDFSLGNYNVDYRALFESIKLFNNVYHSTSLKMVGTRKKNVFSMVILHIELSAY